MTSTELHYKGAVWNKSGSSRSEANRGKNAIEVSRCCGLRAQPGSRYLQ